MFAKSLALSALFSAISAETLWDGSFNETTVSDLSEWSFSNEVGAYQYYIHGDGNITDYVNFDSADEAVKITIDSTSTWEGQTMLRTELIPQTDAAINSGTVYYHFSVKTGSENPPVTTEEHQLAFFESHFTELKYGSSGGTNTTLQWHVNSVAQWAVELEADTWHNVAYEIDFDGGSITFYHSTGSDELTKTAGPIDVSASSNGADWHVGVLRLAGSDATEDWYFSGVYIESASLTTTVSTSGDSSSSGSASSAAASSVAATSVAASSAVSSSAVMSSIAPSSAAASSVAATSKVVAAASSSAASKATSSVVASSVAASSPSSTASADKEWTLEELLEFLKSFETDSGSGSGSGSVASSIAAVVSSAAASSAAASSAPAVSSYVLATSAPAQATTLITKVVSSVVSSVVTVSPSVSSAAAVEDVSSVAIDAAATYVSQIATAVESAALTSVIPTALPTGTAAANVSGPLPERPLPEGYTLKDLLEWIAYILRTFGKKNHRQGHQGGH